MKKRVAVIGCGAVSRVHTKALAASETVILAALCDPDENAARALESELGLTLPLYKDVEALLAAEDLYAVHICTPHFQHLVPAVTALKKGVHVFLEKPACLNAKELEVLLEAEQESTAKLCICFQNRFTAAAQRMKALLSSGEMGKILGARGFVTWRRGGAYYDESPWRGKMATEGGGVLMNQAIHTLDLMQFFCGDPTVVRGQIANYHTPRNDTEDTAQLYLTLPGGVPGLFFATTAYCRSAPPTLEVATEKGVLTLEGETLSLDGAILAGPDGTKAPGKEVWGTGHARLIQLFYQALTEDKPVPVPLLEGARALQTIWALYEQNQS